MHNELGVQERAMMARNDPKVTTTMSGVVANDGFH